MENLRNLQDKAHTLCRLLARYAVYDDEAKSVLEFMHGLFEEIDRGTVVPPIEDRYSWYFANTEGPLFRYDDLCEAHALYSHVLQGWK